LLLDVLQAVRNDLPEKKYIDINSSRGSDNFSRSGIQTGHLKIVAYGASCSFQFHTLWDSPLESLLSTMFSDLVTLKRRWTLDSRLSRTINS